MVENGYVKLHRSLLKWEWIDVPGMLTVFVVCLLMANWKDERYHGENIERGSFVTSVQKFSKICGLSEPYVRKCLKRLNETGEIEVKTSNRGTRIKVHNYALYQDLDEHTVSNRVSNSVSNRVSNRVSNSVTPNEEYKEYKEGKEHKNIVITARVNYLCDSFLDLYPKKTKQHEAETAFKAAVEAGTDPEAILRGLDSWLDYYKELESDRYVKNPCAWIQERCWTKEPPKQYQKRKQELPDWYNPDPDREQDKDPEPLTEEEQEQFKNLMKSIGESFND